MSINNQQFETEFTYEPRTATPREVYNERLLKEHDDIEAALRGDMTLTPDTFDAKLTVLQKLHSILFPKK